MNSMMLYNLTIRLVRSESGIQVREVNEIYLSAKKRIQRIEYLKTIIDLPETHRWDFTLNEVELDKVYSLSELISQT